MKLIGFLIVLLLFGAFFIVSNQNLALKEAGKRLDFARAYYGWFVIVLGNIRHITGNVISLKWLPDSSTKLQDSKIVSNTSLNGTRKVNLPNNTTNNLKINTTNVSGIVNKSK